MRGYDRALVQRMREMQRYIDVDGMRTLLKPVPDAAEHEVDPRLVGVIENKRRMLADRGSRPFCLSDERSRPDKVTYNLCEGEVERDERLIDVDGDHFINAYVYRSKGAGSGAPVMVYLHGGGFIAGDVSLFDNQMRLVAEASGGVVVFPEYRLAPESPFPAATQDAWAAVRWAFEHAAEYGADARRLMVAGDSAGGSLANSCALADEKGIIAELFEIYPLWDKGDYRSQSAYEWSYDAYEFAGDHAPLARSRIEKMRARAEDDPECRKNLYIQGRVNPRDPRISALWASDEQLARFPKTVIASSEFDYLRVSSDCAVRRLRSLGVEVTSIRYGGVDHGFFDMLGTLVQAEELALTMAEELRSLGIRGDRRDASC